MSTQGTPWAWMLGGNLLTFTLTFTRDTDVDHALAAYGTNRAATTLRTSDELEDLELQLDRATLLRVGQLGEWTFGLEFFGTHGIGSSTLHNLSS